MHIKSLISTNRETQIFFKKKFKISSTEISEHRDEIRFVNLALISGRQMSIFLVA